MRDEVPLVTIAEIHEDPWAWDGRRVRIIGETSYCVRLGCAICDPTESGHGELVDRQCMGIGSDVRLATEGSEQSFSSERRNFLMRYARLEIEAMYLAYCSGVPENRDSDVITVCADRANELAAGEVLTVFRYRAASLGPMGLYDDDPAVVLSPDRAREVLEALSARLRPEFQASFLQSYSSELDGIRVITEGDGSDISAAICFCDTDGCENQWPRTVDEAMDAPGNPYQCYFAGRLEDGSWFFPLQ